MKIKQVKVIKSKLQPYWYSDKIGQNFYVTSNSTRYDELKYKVIEVGDHDGFDPSSHYLNVEDVKVIEEFDGEIVMKMAISIRRHGETNESSD